MIITDLSSDILLSEAQKWNIKLVTMTSSFQDEVFKENTPDSFESFYKKLETSKDLPVSSQPSPHEYVELFEEAKRNNEEVLVICVSSKLSGTYNSALLAKNISEYEPVYIVDSLQATVSLRLLVEYAVKLRDQGRSIKEVYEKLLIQRNKIKLYGVPENLVYLKKGGRVPAVLANIADTLKLKPILTINDGLIESIKNVRGTKSALAYMIEATLNDPNYDAAYGIAIAHSHDLEKANKFKALLLDKNPNLVTSIYEIGPIIGTHVGPRGIIVAYFQK